MGDIQVLTLLPLPPARPESTMPDPFPLLRSMGSAFERVVRRVVQELDHGGEFIPVTSLQSSTGFQPYCLVVRKPSSSWFWKPRYKCVNLSIKDILEPDTPEPGA